MRALLPGTAVPELEATTLEGTQFKLSELRGKVVLVDFWATWCGPCVAELPNVKKAYERFADKGFTVVGVSFDRDAETARKFVAERQLKWTQLWAEKADNGPIANQYGVGGIPATFLIGTDGKVIDRDLRGEELVNAIARALKQPKKGERAEGALAQLMESVAPLAKAAALAQTPSESDDPAARALLERTAARYRALKSYADRYCYEARVTTKGEAEPEVGYLAGTLHFAAPGRLVSKSDVLHAYYSDGELTSYTPGEREYTTKRGEDALSALRFDQAVGYRVPGLAMHPLAALLADRDLAADEALSVAVASKVAPETWRGHAGQRLSGLLRLTSVAVGDAPFTAFINDQSGLIEELRVDLTALQRLAAAEEVAAPEVERAEVVVTFDDVQVDTELPAAAFVFNPAGAELASEYSGRLRAERVNPLDWLGRVAPKLAGTTLDGAPFELTREPGQVALVAFWGTWCPGVAGLLGDLQQLAQEFAGQRVVVVGVNRNNADSAAAVKRALTESGATFPQVRDVTGDLSEAWRVAALPTVFLIDAQGQVADVGSEWPADTRAAVAAQLRKLVKAEPLYTPEELARRRRPADDAAQSGGLVLRVPDAEASDERLAAVDSQPLNASRWNMSSQDLDGDGQAELILPDWNGGLSVVNSVAGTVQRVTLRNMPMGGIQTVAGVRIDGQTCWLCAGVERTFTGRAAEPQRAFARLYAPDGEVLWTFIPPVAKNADSTTYAAAGDLDGDGQPEFAIGLTTYVRVMMGENSYTAEDMSGRLFILASDGELLAQRDFGSQVELVLIPQTPQGRRAPVFCLAGGELHRLELGDAPKPGGDQDK